jgi:hypothetical protein
VSGVDDLDQTQATVAIYTTIGSIAFSGKYNGIVQGQADSA